MDKILHILVLLVFLALAPGASAVRNPAPGQRKIGVADIADQLDADLLQPISNASNSLPVVLWHGMGEPPCCARSRASHESGRTAFPNELQVTHVVRHIALGQLPR